MVLPDAFALFPCISMRRISPTLFALLLVLLSACNAPAPAQPTLLAPLPTGTPAPLSTEIPLAAEEEQPAQNTSQILRIWLPPQFDPNAETEAGLLLNERLAAFQERRPEIKLEIRIKATEGEAGLLNALSAAHQAAPATLPDLVALPRPDLESAAQLGILHPVDGLTTILDDPDWFPYARPLANIQDSTYGLPFATDLLGLRYIPSEEFPLPTIENLAEQGLSITFAANSPNASLSFCLDNPKNTSPESLEALFSFYQSSIISPNSAEYKSDKEILETPAVIWASTFFDGATTDAMLHPIPTPNGGSCSLASAWLWALAGHDPELQPAAAELAEYLTQSPFLAEWTAALKLLPPRPTALNAKAGILQELSTVAQPIPPRDMRAALGEIFRAATISVIVDQADPRTVANEVFGRIQ